ncbi:MAG: discoidin domain-containing protein [Kiritimatiellae bacterium]|nr:discoidin domain-containing protein [Kiritimatiellia bacterium]
MKTSITCLMFFILIMAGPAQAATMAADWKQAQELSKQQGCDCFVMLTGTDWDPVSERAAGILKDPRFLTAVGNAVVLQIDHQDYPDPEAQALMERNKGFNHAVYHYPALLAFDKDGQMFGFQKGITDDIASASSLAAKWIQQRTQRDTILSQSEGLQGRDKAEAIGRALDILDYEMARKHGRLIDELRKADPNDATGYVLKYQFNPYPLAGGDIMKGNNLAGAMAQTVDMLKNPRLTTVQRQTVYALRYGILQRDGSSRQDQIRNLKELIAVDPKSDLAAGGTTLLDRLQERVAHDELLERLRKNPDDPAAQKAYIPLAWISKGRLPQLPESRDPLISPNGKITFSSINSQYDKPLDHILIPYSDALGGFHSNRDQQPWVQLDLKTDYQVSRIAMVNEIGNKWRVPPVVIETSRDGKAWTSLLRDAAEKNIYIVNTEERRVRARYVRVRRDDQRQEYFHFSNLLVWGKPVSSEQPDDVAARASSGP